MFFGVRLAVRYSRAVTAMKRLKEEEAELLPAGIREALFSRWTSSWQSPVFYEIAIGDPAWASKLSIEPALVAVRRDFRWMIIGITAALLVLLIQIVLIR